MNEKKPHVPSDDPNMANVKTLMRTMQRLGSVCSYLASCNDRGVFIVYSDGVFDNITQYINTVCQVCRMPPPYQTEFTPKMKTFQFKEGGRLCIQKCKLTDVLVNFELTDVVYKEA